MYTDINQLTPSAQLPLYNKRILITAPRNYAFRLAEQIIKRGGLPVLMPTIETCYLANYAELDTALNNIREFDWIAFTSRNGIWAFFARMDELNIPVSALSDCHLSALGQDAELLLSLSGKVDLVPAEPSPVGIVEELAKIPQIHQQTILVPAPQVIGIPEPNVVPNLVRDLANLGMQVTRVPTYITRCLDENIYGMELGLIRQGIIDVIAFSSAAEVESFLVMVNSHHDYQQCIVACFGPYTATNAKELGVNVAIVSQDYSSFAGFAGAIADYFTILSSEC